MTKRFSLVILIAVAASGVLAGCNNGPFSTVDDDYTVTYQVDGNSTILFVDTALTDENMRRSEDGDPEDFEYELTSEPIFKAAGTDTDEEEWLVEANDVDCDVSGPDGNRRLHCVVDFNDPDFVKRSICTPDDPEMPNVGKMFLSVEVDFTIAGGEEQHGNFPSAALDLSAKATPVSGSRDICIPDADSDGIADNTDNCPNESNADQTDEDEDGVGAACDADDAEDDWDEDDDATVFVDDETCPLVEPIPARCLGTEFDMANRGAMAAQPLEKKDCSFVNAASATPLGLILVLLRLLPFFIWRQNGGVK